MEEEEVTEAGSPSRPSHFYFLLCCYTLSVSRSLSLYSSWWVVIKLSCCRCLSTTARDGGGRRPPGQMLRNGMKFALLTSLVTLFDFWLQWKMATHWIFQSCIFMRTHDVNIFVHSQLHKHTYIYIYIYPLMLYFTSNNVASLPNIQHWCTDTFSIYS